MSKNTKAINLEKRVEAAHYIASNAGSMIKDIFHKKIKTDEKSSQDFVTELDKEIELMAFKVITEQFPEDGFYGEESKPKKSKEGYEWVIDPIDGTNNFVRGLILCGFQLAILHNNEPVFGLIHRPLTQEKYTATKNEGSYYENQLTGEKRKLEVSSRSLENSIAIFDSQVGKKSNPSTLLFSKLVDTISSTRVLGVAVFDLPAVAEGSVEILVSGIANKYDIAAGQLLILEDGGEVYSISGHKNKLDDKLVIFSNKSIKQSLVEKLSK